MRESLVKGKGLKKGWFWNLERVGHGFDDS